MGEPSHSLPRSAGGEILRVRVNATQHLRQAGVPSPEVDARALMQHALGWDAAAMLTRGDQLLSPEQLERIRQLIEQRAKRIPLQHLLGEVEWGGVHLKTDGRALIPRPETEWLLELGLKEADGGQRAVRTVLDVGTGTGALALGFKRAIPGAEVWAVDLCPEALALARENAALNGLEVRFLQADLLKPLGQGASLPLFDLIISNPPYLPAKDADEAQPEVRHDPMLALYAGVDGLTLARPLVIEARRQLVPGGVLLLELDPRNVRVLAEEMKDWQVEVFPDLSGRERFLRAVPLV